MLNLPYSHELTGKALVPTSAIHRDNARVNIHARGFGVDDRVLLILGFHPNAHYA